MRIIDNDSTIKRKINAAIAKQADSYLKKAKSRIRSRIVSITRFAILESDAISELSNGSLKADFGLTQDPSMDIANAVANSVRLGLRPIVATGDRISGGVSLYIQPRTYSNLLSLSSAYQVIEDGGSLPWLSWLLLEGDKILVANYGVKYRPGTGRSGRATMQKNLTPFRVDPEYSGTIDNNFITKALQKFSPQITDAITSELR